MAKLTRVNGADSIALCDDSEQYHRVANGWKEVEHVHVTIPAVKSRSADVGSACQENLQIDFQLCSCLHRRQLVQARSSIASYLSNMSSLIYARLNRDLLNTRP